MERFKRLLALIEVSSQGDIRQSAIHQVRRLAKTNDNEVDAYLKIVWIVLQSERWEARIAAGNALRAIACNFPPLVAVTNTANVSAEEAQLADGDGAEPLSLKTFDVNAILQTTTTVSKSHHQNATSSKTKPKSPKNIGDETSENYQRQREKAQLTLGIDPAMRRLGLADFADKLFDAGDFDQSQQAPDAACSRQTENPENLARTNSVQQKRCVGSMAATATPPDERNDGNWPLAWMWQRALLQVKNSQNWKLRHGATICLREILSAALTHCSERQQQQQQVRFSAVTTHFEFEQLQQFIIAMLTLLATDRFCDFESDDTVAPIRETAAQALATCIQLPPCKDSFMRDRTIEILLFDMLHMPRSSSLSPPHCNITKSGDWQLRYGALLAVKYFVMLGTCSTTNLSCPIDASLAQQILSLSVGLLDDTSEELATVAGDILMRFAEFSTSDAEVVSFTTSFQAVIDKLPTLLLNSDACSTVRGTFIQLLSTLLTTVKYAATASDSTVLDNSCATLLPLLLETLTIGPSVKIRAVALRALVNILKQLKQPKVCNLGQLLDCLYVRALCEPNELISRECANEAWQTAVDQCLKWWPLDVRATFVAYFDYWFELPMQQSTTSTPVLVRGPSNEFTSGNRQRQQFIAGGNSNSEAKAVVECEQQTTFEDLVFKRRSQACDMLAYLLYKLGPALKNSALASDNNNNSVLTTELDYILHSVISRIVRFPCGSYHERELSCLFVAKYAGWCRHHQSMKIDNDKDADDEYYKCTNYISRYLFWHGLYPALTKNNGLIIFSNLLTYCKDMHQTSFRLLQAAIAAGGFALPPILVAVAETTVGDAASLPPSSSTSTAVPSVLSFEQVRQLCSIVAAKQQQQQTILRVPNAENINELLTAAQDAYELASSLVRTSNRRFRAVLCDALVALVPFVFYSFEFWHPNQHFITEESGTSTTTVSTLESKNLPLKPALIIKPLVDALKTETLFEYQKLAADALSNLLGNFIAKRLPGQTVRKVLQNLLSLCCRSTTAAISSDAAAAATDDVEISNNNTSAGAVVTNNTRPSLERVIVIPDAIVNDWLRLMISTCSPHAVVKDDPNNKPIIDATCGLLSLLLVGDCKTPALSRCKVSDMLEAMLYQVAIECRSSSSSSQVDRIVWSNSIFDARKCAEILAIRQRGVATVMRGLISHCYSDTSDDTSLLILGKHDVDPLADIFSIVSAIDEQLTTQSTTANLLSMQLIDKIKLLMLVVNSIDLPVVIMQQRTSNKATATSAAFLAWFQRVARLLTGQLLRHRSVIVRHFASELYACCLLLISDFVFSPKNNDADDDINTDKEVVEEWRDMLLNEFVGPLVAHQPRSSINLTENNAADAVDYFEFGLVDALHAFIIQAPQRTRLALASPLSTALLPRINSPVLSIRTMASHSFGFLVGLLSLTPSTTKSLGSFNTVMETTVLSKANLFEQLSNVAMGSPTDVIPTALQKNVLTPDTVLRPYQQQGVCWLSYLQQLSLGGILCDDMGLGKTLQTLCIVADSTATSPWPSLVVCPSTLISHWSNECKKFILPEFLQPIVIASTPGPDSNVMQLNFTSKNLIIMSYDTVRRYSSSNSSPQQQQQQICALLLRQQQFNYVILDEGHLVRKTKTKTYQAIAALVPRSQHRLVLTGTPVQNHVGELWGLFDFLMPSYLGSQRQFQVRYGKPIAQAATEQVGSVTSSVKSSNSALLAYRPSEYQESGTLALEALHQRVLPFVLRRLKAHVLTDLPPKIIQDYLCELSSVQRVLYDDFQHSHVASEMCHDEADDNEGAELNVTNTSTASTKKPAYAATLKGLHYLRQICNHPLLVFSPSHPLYESVCQVLDNEQSSNSSISNNNKNSRKSFQEYGRQLADVKFSGKLLALKDLLLSCGIGTSTCSSDINVDDDERTNLSFTLPQEPQQHRALIFCQTLAMLELVEHIVLRGELPSVKYMKLTGAVPPAGRVDVVEQFNNDTSVSVMLLTTSLGGLGLNLTGADTVIFVEHDWNPHRDLQAMDRAHRIGQKRVVSVYRLITTGTLEEKIMGMQKFKLFMADAIVNSDNNVEPLKSVQNSEQLLNLLALSATEQTASALGRSPSSSSSSKRTIDQTDFNKQQQQKQNSLAALLENYNPDSDYAEFSAKAFLKKFRHDDETIS